MINERESVQSRGGKGEEKREKSGKTTTMGIAAILMRRVVRSQRGTKVNNKIGKSSAVNAHAKGGKKEKEEEETRAA